MYKSTLVRVLFALIGFGIIVFGGIVGADVGLRALGMIRFEKVDKTELVIQKTCQQQFPRSGGNTKFNLVQRGREEFVIVGDIDNTNAGQLILISTTQWSDRIAKMFGKSFRVYHFIPSLIGFYTTKVIGSILSFIIGGVLLGVARDLSVIDDIILGRKKPWVLLIKRKASQV